MVSTNFSLLNIESNTISDDDHHFAFATRPPFFNGENFYIWKNRMKIFLKAIDFDAWVAIKNGPFVPTHIVDGLVKEKPRNQWSDDDVKKLHPDFRAKHFISCALSNDQFSHVINCETAREMWNTLCDVHEGTKNVKFERIQFLTREYELFCMKPGEEIRDMERRFYNVVNHLASLGERISDEVLVDKVLRSLSMEWEYKVTILRKLTDLKTTHLAALFGDLEMHEQLMRSDEEERRKKEHKKKGSSSTHTMF